ncbi:MAG TPA: ATP-binding protein [Thermoanaerobaculia bacterium]|nr:ATP-binding protein [Thermoanaerobaculia bacterium]
MHRDWFNEDANVFVEIYVDRIEVSSPGGLPKGMRPTSRAARNRPSPKMAFSRPSSSRTLKSGPRLRPHRKKLPLESPRGGEKS